LQPPAFESLGELTTELQATSNSVSRWRMISLELDKNMDSPGSLLPSSLSCLEALEWLAPPFLSSL
jgi:hypothetical protein